MYSDLNLSVSNRKNKKQKSDMPVTFKIYKGFITNRNHMGDCLSQSWTPLKFWSIVFVYVQINVWNAFQKNENERQGKIIIT